MNDKPFLRPHFPKSWTYSQAYDFLIALEEHIGEHVHLGVVIPADAPDPHYQFVTFNDNEVPMPERINLLDGLIKAEIKCEVGSTNMFNRMTFHVASF